MIMVTDIVGSTPLIRRVGDRRFVELLKEHNRIVRTRLRQFDGVEFKHTGDGIAAWFLDPSAAVECALRIEDDLERSNSGRTDPLHIRVGMSAGEVVDDEGDLYGIAVVTAFRICDHARDGRVLASSELRSLVTGERFGFVKIGDTNLKGFTQPLPVYAVARTDS
ncbi:MAG: adenylate/guanylate cyclase domain-containing protein [Actinobacteria bacterium]|nr:adenylate/guanylate cyclase domain-containing protein [Actinomycetota bacterium]